MRIVFPIWNRNRIVRGGLRLYQLRYTPITISKFAHHCCPGKYLHNHGTINLHYAASEFESSIKIAVRVNNLLSDRK
jgi:hypothetical protein